MIDDAPTEFQLANHSPAQIEIDRRVKQKVLAGIELLKEKYGPNWVNKIDLEDLQLTSASSCVLGQLYGSWETGKTKLGLTDLNNPDGMYGFSSSGVYDLAEELSGSGRDFYSQLQAAWEEEIALIRASG